jgi:hypothetical protein
MLSIFRQQLDRRPFCCGILATPDGRTTRNHEGSYARDLQPIVLFGCAEFISEQREHDAAATVSAMIPVIESSAYHLASTTIGPCLGRMTPRT